MKTWILRALVVLSVLAILLLISWQYWLKYEFLSITGALSLQKADRIEISYGSIADFYGNTGNTTKKVTLQDSKTIHKWVEALDEIPFKLQGPGITAKMSTNAVEHKIVFFHGNQELGVLHMRAWNLACPGSELWEFYDSEDKAFVSLVKQHMKSLKPATP